MVDIAAFHEIGGRGPQQGSKSLASILALLLLVSLASPIIFDLPDLGNTKLEGGINITTEDYGAMIYENYTLHYYQMKIPTRNLNTAFGRAQTAILFGNTRIDDLNLYPITRETRYTIEEWNRNFTRGNGSDAGWHNTTLRNTYQRTKYTTTNATTQLDTGSSRNYLIEVQTPTWQTGRWGATGALSFDPNITACGALSTAGTVYTMNQSITAGSADCITIGKQNITLDCQGYSLKGIGGFTYKGIFANASAINTTIRNCNISNFGIAIDMSGARPIINNTNITVGADNQGSGIVLNGVVGGKLSFLNLTGNGAYLLQSGGGSNNNFTNLTFKSHGVYTPFIISGGETYAQFRNLTILNSTFGVYWQDGYYGLVENCYMEVGSYGYSLFSASGFTSNNCWVNVSTAYSSAYPAEAGWWGAYYSQTYPSTFSNSTVYSERTNFLLSEFALDAYFENMTLITSGENALAISSDGSLTMVNSRLIAKNETYRNTGTEAMLLKNNYIAATADKAALLYGTVFGFYFNNTFESNGTVVMELGDYANANTFINNTFKSRNATLLQAASTTYDNIFYWNNFTNTSGIYVNDSAGNQYNTTMATTAIPTLETSGLALASTFAQTLDVGEKICMTATKWLVSFGKNGGNSETGVLQYANHTDITTAAFSGDIATFSPIRQLTSGQCYWLMTRSSGGDRDRHYTPFSSYPLAGTYLTWETSYNGAGDDATNFIEVKNITLTVPNQTHGEGNFWANILNGSVQITGTENSTYGRNFTVGSGGSGYPYNNSTSLGKFICNFAACADKAPLFQLPLVCSVNISYSAIMTPNYQIITRYTNPSYLAHFITTNISNPACLLNITARVFQANNSVLLDSAVSLVDASFVNTTNIPTDRAIRVNVTIYSLTNSSTTETRDYYLILGSTPATTLKKSQTQMVIFLLYASLFIYGSAVVVKIGKEVKGVE